ncbi:hypothetical protein RFI_30898 [Reticulomyxa filosa]|uniref:Uncharacterized protein n=1 Tax=Reticulomyxa filosa TaxID=46433 RepID=X6LZC3_RETFI|nr:hypothetical protein RFI_30898 [Reticulomyxa filosa]|eukprot:ETO06492.1 hypothetical protein RFI_30898 [Reticulomyxa filosa]
MEKKKEMVNAFFNRYSSAIRWESGNKDNKNCIHLNLFRIWTLSGLLLEGAAQAQWFADIYYRMEQKLKRQCAENDDIYSFLFHFLSFTIFQYYQIESSLTTNISVQGLLDDIRAMEEEKKATEDKLKEGAMASYWRCFCCMFKKSNKEISQPVKDYETSVSEASVELGKGKKNNVNNNNNNNENESERDNSIIVHDDKQKEVPQIAKPKSKYSALKTRTAEEELDEDSTGNKSFFFLLILFLIKRLHRIHYHYFNFGVTHFIGVFLFLFRSANHYNAFFWLSLTLIKTVFFLFVWYLQTK